MCLNDLQGNTGLSESEHRSLARLIHKRFGSVSEAANAWRRMLQSNCTDRDFESLVKSETPPLSAETRIKLTCPYCGSEEVRKDASAAFSSETQDWELVTIYDNGFCDHCGKDGIREFDETTISE